jgi:hypothetical protein
MSIQLTPANRQLIRDAVSGLTGDERRREYMRLKSKLLRLNPEYRAADNARMAAREHDRYHANIEESRRKSAEKSRRQRERERLTARLRLAEPLPSPAPRSQAGKSEHGEGEGGGLGDRG